ncbi:hypothetical protein F5879DRAFT_87884 [Lentinula edodes]|nr:hypothetical protein F5879DRAFT_87884 [Lentinula edodes]
MSLMFPTMLPMLLPSSSSSLTPSPLSPVLSCLVMDTIIHIWSCSSVLVSSSHLNFLFALTGYTYISFIPPPPLASRLSPRFPRFLLLFSSLPLFLVDHSSSLPLFLIDHSSSHFLIDHRSSCIMHNALFCFVIASHCSY